MSFKRVLAVFLALCLFASFLPVAIAADVREQTEQDEPKDQTEITEELKEEPEPEHESVPDPAPEPDPDAEPDSNPQPDPDLNPEPEIVMPEEKDPEPEGNQEEAEKEKPSDTPVEEKEPIFTEIPEEETHAVCTMNDTGYQTLQEAVDAAGEQNADIYLIQPLEEDIEIGRNQSITISLNGCGFSGEVVNYGKLTILGDGFFDGALITRAYHIKDGETASGNTCVKNGMFTGILAVEQESDALLESNDPLPRLTVEGGTFTSEEGEELVCRFVRWNESGNAEYTESDDAGEILLTGGVFAHYPAYAAPGYHAVDYGGVYGIEEGSADDQPENNTPEESEIIPVGLQPETGELLDEAEEESTEQNKPIVTDETLDHVEEKKEEKPENAETEPPEELRTVAVDVFVYGDGTVEFEGEKYGNNETIQVAEGKNMELTFVPEPKSELRSVTVGSKGIATPYGTVDEITIDSVSEYTTVTAMFGSVHEYSITYILDGGINSDSNQLSYEEGNKGVDTPIANAEKAGYEFQGWYTDAAFSSQLTVITPTTTGDLTLYAKFEPIEYTITYILNGGTMAEPETHNYTIESDDIIYPTPSKEEHDFAGWFKDSEFTESAVTYQQKGTTGDKTLYAKYTPKEYRIDYVIPEGTINNNPSKYIYGKDTPIAYASKEGYEFKGWYTESSFTTPITVISAGTTGDITLYAKFIPTYTITYVLNGGTMSVPTSQTYTEEDDSIVYPVPSKTSAVFEGWYKSPDFSGSPVSFQPKGTTGNITLYAKWKNIYRIYVYYNTFGTVSYNGAIVPNRAYFDVEEGDNITLYFNPLSTSYYPYNCTVNNVKKGSVSSLTLEDIRDNQVISVTFAPTFARPMTGDGSHVALWAVIMALSGTAAGILLGRKKKKQ